MRTFGIVCAALALAVGSAQAVDYSIDAHLDVKAKTVQGKQILRWTNRSKAPIEDLRFHLYFNAWRDERSSFFNSNRSDNSSGFREDERGAIDIESIAVAYPEDPAQSRTDITSAGAFIQPDDNNPHDRTVIQYLLPRPLQPGESVTAEMGFRTRIPRTVARTGYQGDYFFLAHWFPKLGVLEEDGNWNCHQFIQTEFYSDFGLYEVSLTVPTGWVLGATGEEQERIDNGDGTTTHTYRQDDVHEFAWTTSPDFEVFERQFHHPQLPPVHIRLLMRPDHRGQEERYFRATEAALRYYGEWFGPYPYGHVTVVDPAYRSGSGGMEYPTLFTGGTRWWNPADSGSPEGVTVHECGHQFWYGIVANNEFEDAWLDEGINTYSTDRAMAKAFYPVYQVRRYLNGFIPVLFRDLPRSPRSLAGLGGFHSPLKLDVLSVPSWRQGPGAGHASGNRERTGYRGSAYRLNSYDKPAMVLRTLEGYLGWETFRRAMSTYFERYRLRHPRPADFMAVVEEVSGTDLRWFWSQTIDSAVVFDYAVDRVTDTDTSQEIVIRRWGEGIFPVRIDIAFEDGTRRTEGWDGKARWTRLTYPGTSRISAVAVDPDGILALEVDRTNNTWMRAAPTYLAAAKWSAFWTLWLQNLLECFAFFG